MNSATHTYVVYSGTITTTTSTNAIDVPIADCYTIVISAADVTGTSPTLDVVWANSYDDGTTYQYMPLRSSQITTARTEVFTFPQSLGSMVTDSTVTAATGGILSENFIFAPKGRFSFTVGGTNPSFAVVITAYLKNFGVA